jgi:heptosyltransferase-2
LSTGFQRILALPLYGIGDVLMTTPALRNITERLGSKITCLHMFASTKAVLDGNPHITENIHFPFLSASKLAGVRFLLGLRGRFDASINFYPSNRKDYNLAAFLAGAPLRIGHRYREHDLLEMNFLKNRTIREDDGLHNVEEDLRLLGLLGIEEPEPYPLEVYLDEKEREEAAAWLRERRLASSYLIGFHPGSSLFKAHAMKRWPEEKYARLVRLLAEQSGDCRFLLFGGPEEDALKDSLRAATGLPEKVFPVTTAGIRQSAALMQRCRLFITNDSGLMHLAAALQVPTVALFGPTNPRWLRPWKCRSRVLRHESCPSCFRYSPTPQQCTEGGNFACIREVGVEEVLEAALSLAGEELTEEARSSGL